MPVDPTRHSMRDSLGIAAIAGLAVLCCAGPALLAAGVLSGEEVDVRVGGVAVEARRAVLEAAGPLTLGLVLEIDEVDRIELAVLEFERGLHHDPLDRTGSFGVVHVGPEGPPLACVVAPRVGFHEDGRSSRLHRATRHAHDRQPQQRPSIHGGSMGCRRAPCKGAPVPLRCAPYGRRLDV